MKRILVYADFDFLSAPQEIGTLGYEHVRGKDHFIFEYSREWLKQYGGILLSDDLMNVPSLQHPRGNDNVFGFVKDSFPDRWGSRVIAKNLHPSDSPPVGSISPAQIVFIDRINHLVVFLLEYHPNIHFVPGRLS